MIMDLFYSYCQICDLFYRPYVIKGQQLQVFLEDLRNITNTNNHLENENSFTKDEFTL